MAEDRQGVRTSPRGAVTTDAIRLTTFAQTALVSAGADQEEAQVVAQALVWADRVGRPTQGVWRLDILMRRLKRGLYRSPCEPVFHPISETAVVVDGRDGLGHLVASTAMRHAIELASQSAIGVVGVRNSNYFGAAGFYAQLAAEAGMIGIAMSNSFPKVAAYGGKRPVLGTNPLAFAAPRENGESFILDMSTSPTSGSSVRWTTEEQGGADGPAAGAVKTTETKQNQDLIEPFGGAKGFGLGLMVEILTGALTGAGLSDEVHSMYGDFTHPGNNGHFFMVLDLGSWTALSTYHRRVGNLLQMIETSAGSGSPDGVRIPGQARWAALAQSDSEGITLDGRVTGTLETIAANLGVPRPW